MEKQKTNMYVAILVFRSNFIIIIIMIITVKYRQTEVDEEEIRNIVNLNN